MKSSELRRRGVLRDQHGVTLVETVVALGLFGLSVAAIGQFLTGQIRMASSNHNYTLAYALAEDELEGIRALRYGDMAGSAKEIEKGALLFEVKSEVTDGSPAPNMKRIRVDVNWNEPGGARHVSVHTIYTAIRR